MGLTPREWREGRFRRNEAEQVSRSANCASRKGHTHSSLWRVIGDSSKSMSKSQHASGLKADALEAAVGAHLSFVHVACRYLGGLAARARLNPIAWYVSRRSLACSPETDAS